MILATKADVDEAKRELADRLEDAAYAIQCWQNHPTEPALKRAANDAVFRAEWAFEEYERALKNWAAGPSAGAVTP